MDKKSKRIKKQANQIRTKTKKIQNLVKNKKEAKQYPYNLQPNFTIFDNIHFI